MKFSRRHFLLAGGLLGGSAYVNQRGLRYPRMGFEPLPLPTHAAHLNDEIELQDLIFLGVDDGQHLNLRAYSPSPAITVTPHTGDLNLSINNISESAVLQVIGHPQASVKEDIRGITRNVNITKSKNQKLILRWKLAEEDSVDFAVIGDTGGADELAWSLQRAKQLNTQFLLHLGDFNYAPGEYARAIKQFHQAELPVFVSIGNHDFNDSGLVYPHFRSQIGPMNTAFSIAGTRFINLDTGADFFPPYSGNRGAMLRNLLQTETADSDQLVFTHKPFVDSRVGEHHVISGLGETDWLLECMKKLGIQTYICGHVHRSTEINFRGINQITAGEGLGFEDLRTQQQVAKILVGRAERGKKVNYSWQPLNMPWALHTSPTHLSKLKKQALNQQLEWYQRLF